MKLLKYIFLLLILTPVSIFAQVQCAIDVTINEGATISMCADSPLPITASNGFVTYGWTGPETLAGQSITPQFSGQYIVAAEDGVGCISVDTIQVIINANPIPVVISSEGNPICAIPGGTTLSLASAYTSYDWGGGITTPTFFAPSAGAYSVTVIDGNGCTGQVVTTITTYDFNLTATSASGCYGSTTVLEAFGGASYLWSTSETGSTIIVNPAATTIYSVTITNGTCVEQLSTTVEPATGVFYSLVDTLYLSPGDQEFIEGPPGFESYNWFPSNQIFNPIIQNITFSGTTSQIITMEATHESGCVYRDSVVIIMVEVTIPNGFSPNGDSFNEFFVIPELEVLDGDLQIWNRWGDVVLDVKSYNNLWNGTCQTTLCLGKKDLPSGIYFYHLTVKDIHFDGFVTLKR